MPPPRYGGPGGDVKFVTVDPHGVKWANPTKGKMTGCNRDGQGCGKHRAPRDRDGKKEPHKGIDMASKAGQDINALSDGRAMLARSDEYGCVDIAGNEYYARSWYIDPTEAIKKAGRKVFKSRQETRLRLLSIFTNPLAVIMRK